MTHFCDPRFTRQETAQATTTPRRNPSPKQLATLWANRAQKASELQTTGVYHVA